MSNKKVIEGEIIRKGELIKEQQLVYNELFRCNSSWSRYNSLSDDEKMKLLKPVLAFILNIFFEEYYHLFNEERNLTKELREFIKWYFDRNLVPDAVQMSVIKRKKNNDDISIFNYLNVHKRRLKDVVDLDTQKLFYWALRKGDRKVVMQCVKCKPYLYNELYYLRHRHWETIFDEKFIRKAGRVAVLQPNAAKSGLYVKIPREVFTPVFNKRYVSMAGKNLQDIPPELITAELCQIAVEQSGSALEYVPPELRTQELCALALERSSTALRFIPADKQKSSLILQALMKNNSARRYIKKGAVGHTAK